MRDAVLKLEAINDDKIDKLREHRAGRMLMGKQEAAGAAGALGRRPFVKQVVGADYAGRPVKKDVRGYKDYRAARGLGRRGVFYCWNLPHGGCYQIQEATSLLNARRYYAIVIDGAIHEISEKEASLYGAGKIQLAY